MPCGRNLSFSFFGTAALVHASRFLSTSTYVVTTSSIYLSSLGTDKGKWCFLHSVVVVFEEDSLLKLVFRVSTFDKVSASLEISSRETVSREVILF